MWIHRVACFLVLMVLGETLAFAQFPNNVGGIRIDAEGVVTSAMPDGKSLVLNRKKLEAAARSGLPEELSRRSDSRKVSLVKLEKALIAALGSNEPPTMAMRHLAGLQRIDYVFVYPDTQDLVIAGPAEGFAEAPDGRVVGMTTGRPTLRLDDWIVAWRSSDDSQKIGCSIDPEPRSLAALQQFLAANSTPATPDVVRNRYRRMASLLGLQNIRVFGVPDDSHLAAVLVEADWRMKRMTLGLETHGVRGLKSHLAMIGAGSGNSLQRWWFTPYFDGLHRSTDGLAFHWSGPRVQLVAQEELSNAGGQRRDAAVTRASTQGFAKQFTDRYEELASRLPIFAELQNGVDLCVLAALIRHKGLDQKIGWKHELFDHDQQLDYPRNAVPRKVQSLVNIRPAGSVIVGLLGGVSLETREVMQDERWQASSPELRLEGIRTDATADVNADWWWD